MSLTQAIRQLRYSFLTLGLKPPLHIRVSKEVVLRLIDENYLTLRYGTNLTRRHTKCINTITLYGMKIIGPKNFSWI